MALTPKPYISVAEAAEIIGCTEGRVRQLLDAETIAGEKLHERALAVEKKSVEKFAAIEQTRGRPRINATS